MECVSLQCSSELAELRALHCAVRISFLCLACMHHSMHFSRFQCSALVTFHYIAVCIAVHFSGLEDVGVGEVVVTYQWRRQSPLGSLVTHLILVTHTEISNTVLGWY